MCTPDPLSHIHVLHLEVQHVRSMSHEHEAPDGQLQTTAVIQQVGVEHVPQVRSQIPFTVLYHIHITLSYCCSESVIVTQTSKIHTPPSAW